MVCNPRNERMLQKGGSGLRPIFKFQKNLILLLLFFICTMTLSTGSAEPFSVKRVGNLIPFNENAFLVSSPEKGHITIRIHDDISVYRIIEQEIEPGETTIQWDGCAFNHEKLAAKNYTVTAVLQGNSGEEYRVSFNTPVEYTGQCLQYVLPSSRQVSLTNPDEWFVEFRTVQKGTVKFVFHNDHADCEDTVYSVNTTGGRINRLTYTELTGKNPVTAGNYRVNVYENTKKDERFSFDIDICEEGPQRRDVFLTGEILPEEGMTEEEIWQIMQQPSVVVDLDPFKHQKVFKEKDKTSDSLGTLHGQTQAVKVMKTDNEWAYIGAWNHEAAEYMEGWVPLSVLKVSEPNPEYGILISKQKQTLDVYYKGKRIDTLEVSTGRPEDKHPEQETAAGSFLTGYHRVDFSTNGKKYDYVIQYDGGNLLHQIPYEWGKDKKDFSLGRGYLGAKASHACIRIQSEPGENGINAYWIWTHIPYHTRVLILDDPAERRPVTERPKIIESPIKAGDGTVRLTFEDSGQEDGASCEKTVEETEGHIIGFTGCTEKEYLKDPEIIPERIGELLKSGCERIVLKCYWSDRNEEKHTAVYEAMARKGIRSGANLVIGYGNRTCLGCEEKDKGIILYGLGVQKSKKTGKRNNATSLKAEVIFDFSKEESIPTVTLITTDDSTDLQQIIERFADDSVGPGIGKLYFCTDDQLKQ